MKIRNGFVSNSSASSFCIYGIFIERNNNINEEEIEKAGLEVEIGDPALIPDGSYYIGRSWRSIKDDETGAQFKKNVEQIITKIFGKKYTCSTFQEEWYAN